MENEDSKQFSGLLPGFSNQGSGSAVPVVKAREYAIRELEALYALGRFFAEIADLQRATIIFQGLVAVAPEFLPGRLGAGYVALLNGGWHDAESQVRAVLARDARQPQALLMGVIAALNLNERSTAGSRLGEFGELIDSGQELDPRTLQLYRSQLGRYRQG